jgi:hypothetical protein
MSARGGEKKKEKKIRTNKEERRERNYKRQK